MHFPGKKDKIAGPISVIRKKKEGHGKYKKKIKDKGEKKEKKKGQYKRYLVFFRKYNGKKKTPFFFFIQFLFH